MWRCVRDGRMLTLGAAALVLKMLAKWCLIVSARMTSTWRGWPRRDEVLEQEGETAGREEEMGELGWQGRDRGTWERRTWEDVRRQNGGAWP